MTALAFLDDGSLWSPVVGHLLAVLGPLFLVVWGVHVFRSAVR